VAIEISVNVFYGVQLQKVASDVQNRLRPQIQQLTGLKIQSIDIVIRGIDEPKKDDEEISDNEQ